MKGKEKAEAKLEGQGGAEVIHICCLIVISIKRQP